MEDKKKPIDPELISEAKKSQNHLEFFVERSAETVDRTLKIVQQLQQEIKHLKDGLEKTENECKNAQEEESPRQKIDN